MRRKSFPHRGKLFSTPWKNRAFFSTQWKKFSDFFHAMENFFPHRGKIRGPGPNPEGGRAGASGGAAAHNQPALAGGTADRLGLVGVSICLRENELSRFRPIFPERRV